MICQATYRNGKHFLTTNLRAIVYHLPWFYGMIKIHKTPWNMRPIISCTGSLMHPIVVWTDSKFQQVAADMPAYFKYSMLLKDKITTMDLPPVTMLLTKDATSMYTNIQTCPALNQLSQYFNVNQTKYQHLPVDAMIRYLQLMMNNNIFRFGDSLWLQLKGTAMGTPSAPTYATVL